MTTLMIAIVLCQRPPQAPPVNERLDDHERRISALEAKFAVKSTSPDCTCTNCKCDPCECGTITVRCPSFPCPACEQAKQWLTSQGKTHRTVVDDTLSSWPQFDLCENGQCRRLTSQTEMRAAVAPAMYAETSLPSRTITYESLGSCSTGSCSNGSYSTSYSGDYGSYSSPVTVTYQRRGLFGGLFRRSSRGGGCSSCR